MLWTLLRGAGGRYASGTSYDLEELELEKSGREPCRPEDLDLDEIDPELVGGCRSEMLLQHLTSLEEDKDSSCHYADPRINFTIRALLMMTSLPFFLELVGPPPFTNGPPTGVKWSRHVGQLLCCGLFLAVSTKRELKAYASYFSILKSGGLGCRTIFNGRLFSLRCNRPPSTNLPDVIVILHALHELCWQSGPFACVIGDVRHMFHQLGVRQEISNYFGLWFKKEDCPTFQEAAKAHKPGFVFPEGWDGHVRMASLPMGFSYSPWAAQSVGFGVLILALEHAGVTGLEPYKMCSQPPPCIRLYRDGRLYLVCALWLDNLIVATSEHALSLSILKSVKHIFNDVYKLKLKEIEWFSPAQLKRNSARKPTYLNLEFCTQLHRGRNGEKRFTLQWCPIEKKREKWRLCSSLLLERLTARVVSKVAGTILWAHHIRLTPLCRLQEIIDLVRRAAGRAAEKGSWKADISLTAEEKGCLREGLLDAGQEVWSSYASTESHTPIYATDSSGWRWAYVTWLSKGGPIDSSLSDAADWQEKMMPASIFLKELTCATVAIERICSSHHQKRIILFCDNTAACQVIRRLASSTHAGSELAVRIANALEKAQSSIEVLHIASIHNPADTPTRSRRFFLIDTRVAAMWSTLNEHTAGRLLEVDMSKHRRSFQPSAGGVRHQETDQPLTDEDSSDEESTDDDFERLAPEDSDVEDE